MKVGEDGYKYSSYEFDKEGGEAHGAPSEKDEVTCMLYA